MLEKDDLDLLLDSALKTYADPGPDAGLEDRVLANLTVARRFDDHIAAAASQPPRRRWLPWAIALPLAACLVLLLIHAPRTKAPANGPAPQSHSASQTSKLTASTDSPATHRARPARTIMPRHHATAASFAVAHSVALPKLDVFPTPVPLTPQERAFAVFAANAPEPQRQALLETQKQLDAPLSIAAIQIPPFNSPQQGPN